MDRINGANWIDIGAGRRGFRDRNLAAGQAGTTVTAAWANGVQEELVRAIELCGLTPAAANREQLIQALRRLAGGNTRAITGSTTLTADDAGIVLVSAASGALTVTLPAATAAGGRPMRFHLVRTDSTGNAVTIQRAGSDLIDGASSVSLPAGARQTLVCDGVSAWVCLEPQGGLRFGQTAVFAGSGGAAGFSGSWTVPAGVFLVMIEAIGAGGGGGGSAAGSAGGGGGGGAFVRGWFRVQPGVALSIQAGTGGAAGGVSAAGSAGTASFVTAPAGPVTGTLLTAGGGTGGAGATAGNVGAGGGGGAAAGGAMRIAGAAGQVGQLIGSAYRGGMGGSAPFAGGVGYPGSNGAIAGCGGGGGWDNAVAPGAGAGGIVVIAW
jgi:hypothetical protein